MTGVLVNDEQMIGKYIREAMDKEQFGQYGDAIKACQKVVELRRDIPEVYYIMGCCFGKLAMPHKAIESYIEAIKHQQDYKQAIINLGVEYFNSQNYKEAEAVFQKAVEVDPSDSRSHFNLGNALYGQEKYELAVQSYRNATELNSNHVNAHYCTAECYLLLGDTELALSYVNKLSYLDEEMANELLGRIFPGQDGSFTGNSRR
jgi:tetratricopeptide (TPR) repeat protein